MNRMATRTIKLITAPDGSFRRYRIGTPIPKGWIVIQDKSVFYHDELLDVFNSIPMLKDSDWKPDHTKGTNG